MIAPDVGRPALLYRGHECDAKDSFVRRVGRYEEVIEPVTSHL